MSSTQTGHAVARRRRWTVAVLLSVSMHALLLDLMLGDLELGLAGFAVAWRDRRVEVSAPRVAIVAARVDAAQPAVGSLTTRPHQESIDQNVGTGKKARSSAAAALPRQHAPDAVATAHRMPQASTDATAAPAAAVTERIGGAAPEAAAASRLPAVGRSDDPTLAAPPTPPLPAPGVAAAPSASSPQPTAPAPAVASDRPRDPIEPQAPEQDLAHAEADDLEREARQQAQQSDVQRAEEARLEDERRLAAQQEALRQQAAREEAARTEAARLEAEREQAARLAQAQQEADRQQAAREEAARAEAARLEAEREQAALRAQAQQEAARQHAAREEAARAEAARLEAERAQAALLAQAQQEAARQQAARAQAARQDIDAQEAARQAAARQPAAPASGAQANEARREALLRAIGRQLDAEAAQREAATTARQAASQLPLSLSTARRVRLWGRTDPNAELVGYALAWARKIESNTPPESAREVAKRPHRDPMVTVALRSDGSVESVVFVISSGVAEIDTAILRIIEAQKPYPAFPPGLASQYDVVEIRRTWYFDNAVRLY